MSGAEVHWTTNDTAVAIDATGLATGRFTSTAKTVAVTATTGTVSASVSVLLKGCIHCGSWRALPGLSEPRWNSAIDILDGVVYVAGGATRGGVAGFSQATVEALDLATGKWSTRASMPDRRQVAQAVAFGGRLYVFGGQIDAPSGATAIVRMYDPTANAWTELAPIPRVRNGSRPLVIGQKIYAFSVNPGVIDIYDPATNSWTLGATTPTPPFYNRPVVLGGKIYFFDNDAGVMYDPSTDTWSTRAPMPSRRSEVITAALRGKVYTLGGHAPPVPCGDFLCQGAPSYLVEVFDPATNSWTPGSPIPVTGQISVADTVGGKLLLRLWTSNDRGGVVTTYDPERNVWAVRESMPLPDSSGFYLWERAISAAGSVVVIMGDSYTSDRSAVRVFTP